MAAPEASAVPARDQRNSRPSFAATARCARSRKVPHLFGRRHGEKSTPRRHAEHSPPLNLALLTEFDKIEEERACHFRPQVAADMQVRFEAAGPGLRLEAQRMRRSALHPVVYVGAEVQNPARG